jgi:hypothetical protein
VREHRKSVTYAGSQTDKNLIIISKLGEDETPQYKTMELPSSPLCAILSRDDKILIVGCVDN